MPVAVSVNKQAIIQLIQQELPSAMAIYAFGSRIQGTARADSDLDLAVLVAGYADPVMLWNLSQTLANNVLCDVDLVDMRKASTVLQYQILTTGEQWWNNDNKVALFEAAVLSDKTDLDTARAPLLNDIRQRGNIYD